MKIGGLADLSGALPAALHTQGLDINKLLLPGTTLPLLNVSCDVFFNRDGGPYQTPSGSNWPDNAPRFGLILYVAAWLGSNVNTSTWQPDLVHCNDWQTGRAAATEQTWRHHRYRFAMRFFGTNTD